VPPIEAPTDAWTLQRARIVSFPDGTVSWTAIISDADAESDAPNGLAQDLSFARTENPALPVLEWKNGAWTTLALPQPELDQELEGYPVAVVYGAVRVTVDAAAGAPWASGAMTRISATASRPQNTPLKRAARRRPPSVAIPAPNL
jgi:hypothetical protein